ncbi:MAG: hypothetical protein GY845_19445 [Planctomycetes bacterium]|nr:hypothetical protein [Planctomycetota bacterium]
MKTGNLRILRAIPLVLLAILLCPFAYGKVIYVDDDAIGANDGSSWENAYVYLQEALADANTAEKPVEIRVAQGIYKPDQGGNQILGNREATFHLINDVSLKGGYAGIGEADPNAHDLRLYETILSGDLKSNDAQLLELLDLLYEPTRGENSNHVVSGIYNEDTAVLDGFNITAGNANGPEYAEPNSNGAGLYNFQSSPMVINCVFTGNSARWSGAGMHNINSNPKVINCTFNKNSAGTFSGGHGGGMYNSPGSNSILTNCKFSNNRAGQGGGIHALCCTPTAINCNFINNSANFGGGVQYKDSIDPMFIGCSFSGNSASKGAAARFIKSSPILTNCLFTGNSAGSYGGAIAFSNMSTCILANCTFAANIAPQGCTLSCDHVFYGPSIVYINNCILWNDGDKIWNNDDSIITITYSNVQGLIRDRSEKLIGCINKEPYFIHQGYWDLNGTPVDPQDDFWVDGDYHLKSQSGRWDPNSESWVVDDVTSACIDAGDPNSPVGDELEPNGGRVNMGAYGGTADASKSGDLWWFETTQGPIIAEGLGVILPHEHIFTDLRGPATRGYGQADAADVVRVMAPLLEEAKQSGIGLLFECSSIGVGRNVSILSEVSAASGLPVVVSTGVYGRANFAPIEHQNMSEDELTELFISEIREGIEGTGIKAGFIKIATGGSNMNALEEKILRAAGRAAKETGAAVASHTTVSSNATRQADILESISPEIRFIWVHAQSANNRNLYKQLAERGVFIELDSLGWNPEQDSTFIAAIKELLAAGYGEQILLSHDAGWYRPGEQNGGTQKPYTYLIETFIPKLRDNGVDDETIRMITEINPIRAFGFNQDVNP